jgi:hypothetical protein
MKILFNPKTKTETKVAAVLFLILQGYLSARAINSAFKAAAEATPSLRSAVTEAAETLVADEAYSGYIALNGTVGFVKSSASMPGHVDAVAQGLIPKGSQGFSVIVNNQGEVALILGRSQLNPAPHALPDSVFQSIIEGLRQSSAKIADDVIMDN